MTAAEKLLYERESIAAIEKIVRDVAVGMRTLADDRSLNEQQLRAALRFVADRLDVIATVTTIKELRERRERRTKGA